MANGKTVIFGSISYDFTPEGWDRLRAKIQPAVPPGCFLSYDEHIGVQLQGPHHEVYQVSSIAVDRWQRTIDAHENSQDRDLFEASLIITFTLRATLTEPGT